MPKVSSASGIMCLVKDLSNTAEFYGKLGLTFKKREADYATAYLNWFWIEFVVQDKVEKSVFQKEAGLAASERGAGIFLHISVDDVEEFYDAILAKGLKPANKPKKFPWGRREFVIRDPDGYRLVFFDKISPKRNI